MNSATASLIKRRDDALMDGLVKLSIVYNKPSDELFEELLKDDICDLVGEVLFLKSDAEDFEKRVQDLEEYVKVISCPDRYIRRRKQHKKTEETADK